MLIAPRVWVIAAAIALTPAAPAGAAQSHAKSTEQPPAPQPEKTFTVAVSNLLGAKGPVVVDVIPGSPNDMLTKWDDIVPSRACLHGGPASTCYHARLEKEPGVRDMARPYGDHTTAEVLELGDNSSVILFQATLNGVTYSERLVALLALDSSGRLVNLLPPVTASESSGFQYWHDRSISKFGILTKTYSDWDLSREGRWDDHHFMVLSYEYCPAAGRFAQVDRFRSRHKYPMEPEEGDVAGNVLKSVMPQVKARLQGQPKRCRKNSAAS